MLIQFKNNYWGGLCFDCKHAKSYDAATRRATCPKWGKVHDVGACKYFIDKGVSYNGKR